MSEKAKILYIPFNVVVEYFTYLYKPDEYKSKELDIKESELKTKKTDIATTKKRLETVKIQVKHLRFLGILKLLQIANNEKDNLTRTLRQQLRERDKLSSDIKRIVSDQESIANCWNCKSHFSGSLPKKMLYAIGQRPELTVRYSGEIQGGAWVVDPDAEYSASATTKKCVIELVSEDGRHRFKCHDFDAVEVLHLRDNWDLVARLSETYEHLAAFLRITGKTVKSRNETANQCFDDELPKRVRLCEARAKRQQLNQYKIRRLRKLVLREFSRIKRRGVTARFQRTTTNTIRSQTQTNACQRKLEKRLADLQKQVATERRKLLRNYSRKADDCHSSIFWSRLLSSGDLQIPYRKQAHLELLHSTFLRRYCKVPQSLQGHQEWCDILHELVTCAMNDLGDWLYMTSKKDYDVENRLRPNIRSSRSAYLRTFSSGTQRPIEAPEKQLTVLLKGKIPDASDDPPTIHLNALCEHLHGELETAWKRFESDNRNNDKFDGTKLGEYFKKTPEFREEFYRIASDYNLVDFTGSLSLDQIINRLAELITKNGQELRAVLQNKVADDGNREEAEQQVSKLRQKIRLKMMLEHFSKEENKVTNLLRRMCHYYEAKERFLEDRWRHCNGDRSKAKLLIEFADWWSLSSNLSSTFRNGPLVRNNDNKRGNFEKLFDAFASAGQIPALNAFDLRILTRFDNAISNHAYSGSDRNPDSFDVLDCIIDEYDDE